MTLGHLKLRFAFFVNQLTIGFIANETPIPIVPACGEGIPLKYKVQTCCQANNSGI